MTTRVGVEGRGGRSRLVAAVGVGVVLLAVTNAALPAAGGSVFERVDEVVFDPDEFRPSVGAVDPSGDFAYLADDGCPTKTARVDLETFDQAGTVVVDLDDLCMATSVGFDAAGRFAYVSYNLGVGKIDLETLELVDKLTFEQGEWHISWGMVDRAGKYGYYTTWTNPVRVVKVDLERFERVGSAAIEQGGGPPRGVLDPAGQFGYFTNETDRVVKIDLQTMTQVDSTSLLPDFDDPHYDSPLIFTYNSLMDPTGKYAYFVAEQMWPHPAGGRIFAVDLDTFEPLARTFALEVPESTPPGGYTLWSGESFRSGMVAPDGQFALFGSENSGSNRSERRVVKFDLDSFERIGSIELPEGQYVRSLVSDPAGRYAYAVSWDRVIKLAISEPPSDTTPPAVAPNVDGTLGDNGWYTSDVTVTWSVTDDESAVTSTDGCDEVTVTEDTAGDSFACTATSAGGASTKTVTIKRDATPPVVTVTGATNEATYVSGIVPTAGCDTADATSGVATPAGLSLTGGNPDGTGTFTASCSGAVDVAGNSGSDQITYHVVTAQQATAALQGELQDLVDGGQLTRGQANGVSRPLTNAIRSLNNDRTAPACSQLQDFIDGVGGLTPAPLDADTAATLIAQAQAIREATGC